LEGHAMPRAEFESALTQLYQIKGWDPESGKPTKERLEELTLDWAVSKLE